MFQIEKTVADFALCRNEEVSNLFGHSVYVYAETPKFPGHTAIPRRWPDLKQTEILAPAPTFEEICQVFRKYNFELVITCTGNLVFEVEITYPVAGQAHVRLLSSNEKLANSILRFLLETVKTKTVPVYLEAFAGFENATKFFCDVCGQCIQYNYYFGNPGSPEAARRICEECAEEYPELKKHPDYQFVTHYLNG